MQPSATLSQDYGVLDTAFLLQELKDKKWIIVRAMVTLAALALLFTLKPHYPNVKATLRVDPPAGRTLSLGNLYNVDTEIGSIKSYSMVLDALERAQYYALVTPIMVEEEPSKDRPEDDKPGALHFHQLFFPKAMEGRQWVIEITAPDRFDLKTKSGDRIASAAVGELITGTAQQGSQHDQSGRYRIEVSAIEARVGSRFSVRPMQPEALAGLILSQLSVTKRNGGPGSNLLDIELSLPDVTLAYHLVQYITQHYILQSIERQSASQQQAIDKLQSSLEELKDDVEQGKQALLDFYAETNAADPELELRNLIPKRSELQAKLQQAEVKRAQLELIYTPRHPALQAVIEEIALIETNLADVNETIAKLPQQQSNLDQIKRELAISTDLYQSAIKELARVQLETNSLPQNVHLIDAPRVRAQGRTKYILQLIIFGGMLGFIVGLALVLLSASVRLGKLYSLTQLMKLTRLPVHQTILTLRRGVLDESSRTRIDQIAQYSLHQSAASPGQQWIGICGVRQDADTARLTLDLACALGREKRVLLVDAHLYHSPLAPLLTKNPQSAGLTELLTQRASAPQVIQPTLHAGVSCLSCGKELANYDLLRDIQTLKNHLLGTPFDAVILFLPPPAALPQTHALLSGFDRLLHFIQTGQTLEQIQRHLIDFEGLETTLQHLYVYQSEAKTRRVWRRRRVDRRKITSVQMRSPNPKREGRSKAPPSYRKAAKPSATRQFLD